MKTIDPYMEFYVLGRTDIAEEGFKLEVDLGDLAKRVLCGESIHTVTTELADASVKTQSHSRDKRDWLAANTDLIKDAGGDKEKAYQKFCEGRRDEIRHMLEDETANELEPMLEAGDDDDAPEGEDDEDGDEEAAEDEEDDADAEDKDDADET